MGEFATRSLLGGALSRVASDAASGWDGDLYVIAGRPGAYVFNWVSVWDTEEDATEFESAHKRWFFVSPLSGRSRRVLAALRVKWFCVRHAVSRIPPTPPNVCIVVPLSRARKSQRRILT